MKEILDYEQRKLTYTLMTLAGVAYMMGIFFVVTSSVLVSVVSITSMFLLSAVIAKKFL